MVYEYDNVKDEATSNLDQDKKLRPLNQNDIICIACTPTIFEVSINNELVSSTPHNFILEKASMEFENNDNEATVAYLGYSSTFIDE